MAVQRAMNLGSTWFVTLATKVLKLNNNKNIPLSTSESTDTTTLDNTHIMTPSSSSALFVDIDTTTTDATIRRIRRFIEKDDSIDIYDSSSSEVVGDNAGYAQEEGGVIEFDSYVECKPCWQPLPRRVRKKGS